MRRNEDELPLTGGWWDKRMGRWVGVWGRGWFGERRGIFFHMTLCFWRGQPLTLSLLPPLHALTPLQTGSVCDPTGSSGLSWAFWHSSPSSLTLLPLPPAVCCPLRTSILAVTLPLWVGVPSARRLCIDTAVSTPRHLSRHPRPTVFHFETGSKKKKENSRAKYDGEVDGRVAKTLL